MKVDLCVIVYYAGNLYEGTVLYLVVYNSQVYRDSLPLFVNSKPFAGSPFRKNEALISLCVHECAGLYGAAVVWVCFSECY